MPKDVKLFTFRRCRSQKCNDPQTSYWVILEFAKMFYTYCPACGLIYELEDVQRDDENFVNKWTVSEDKLDSKLRKMSDWGNVFKEINMEIESGIENPLHFTANCCHFDSHRVVLRLGPSIFAACPTCNNLDFMGQAADEKWKKSDWFEESEITDADVISELRALGEDTESRADVIDRFVEMLLVENLEMQKG
ncbi:MAG: hypothetical protein ACOZBH_01255 [Patescibacteria group bacterium]